MSAEVRNVIVIGSGPAGLTASIYLARAELKPLLIAGVQPGGQLTWTTLVENFPGFKDGVMGPQLVADMLDQAKKFGTEVIQDNVTKIDVSGDVKQVWVGDKLYQAKTLIITTGAKARMLDIGEEKLLGRGVGTCAVCDAAFYRNKRVYVIGGGDAAMEDAIAVRKFTEQVTIVHRGDSFRASKIMQERVLNQVKIPVMWNSEVVGFAGTDSLTAITVRNTKTGETEELPADGLFLAIGHMPETDFIGEQLVTDNHGYLITAMTSPEPTDNKSLWLNDYPTKTNVPGVFGAGDVVDLRYRQAVTAAGNGCQAALDVEKYLGVLGMN